MKCFTRNSWHYTTALRNHSRICPTSQMAEGSKLGKNSSHRVLRKGKSRDDRRFQAGAPKYSGSVLDSYAPEVLADLFAHDSYRLQPPYTS